MIYKAYVGTYSVRGSKGIYLIEADMEMGILKILDTWPAVSPSYLAISNGILYAALECGEFEGVSGGGVASYAIGQDGSLSLLSAKPTHGRSPCHVCPAPNGKTLFVSNFGDGKLSVFDVRNGVLGYGVLIVHSGRGPNVARQKGPHVHCAQFEPVIPAGDLQGQSSHPGVGRLCVVDLGIDRAIFYKTADMSASGSCFATEGGAGPRHVVFAQRKPYAWVICELSNEVYAFERVGGKRLGVYPTLPGDFTGQSSCAAIKLSPDERRLYASNRGHDSIACFDIDEKTGALTLIAIRSTGGRTPRDFAISPDGLFLFAANQDSDKIRVFRLENGAPVDTGLSLDIPSPVCVLM